MSENIEDVMPKDEESRSNIRAWLAMLGKLSIAAALGALLMVGSYREKIDQMIPRCQAQTESIKILEHKMATIEAQRPYDRERLDRIQIQLDSHGVILADISIQAAKINSKIEEFAKKR